MPMIEDEENNMPMIEDEAMKYVFMTEEEFMKYMGEEKQYEYNNG